MTGPISPKEAADPKRIPAFIYEAVNSFLTASGARFTQNELLEALRLPRSWNGSEVTRDMVFKYGWLDFEAAYEEKGWKVEFDRPGYNETYEAQWLFTPKKARK